MSLNGRLTLNHQKESGVCIVSKPGRKESLREILWSAGPLVGSWRRDVCLSFGDWRPLRTAGGGGGLLVGLTAEILEEDLLSDSLTHPKKALSSLFSSFPLAGKLGERWWRGG